MTRVDPNLWQIPNWHSDWDGEFTFAALRAFAKALFDSTDLNAELAIIEEGWAHLDVLDGPTRIGLVYVNRGDAPSGRLFTIYAGAEEDELTTADIEAAMRFLDEHRTPFPDDPDD